MPVTRLNHAVLYVRDAERSATFYEEVLGFRRLTMVSIPGAVFMQAPGSTNDHDLGLFSIGAGAGASPAGRGAVGLYHLAWEVDTLDELERLAGILSERGAAHEQSYVEHLAKAGLDVVRIDGIAVTNAAVAETRAAHLFRQVDQRSISTCAHAQFRSHPPPVSKRCVGS